MRGWTAMRILACLTYEARGDRLDCGGGGGDDD